MASHERDAVTAKLAADGSGNELWGIAVYYPPWRGYVNCYALLGSPASAQGAAARRSAVMIDGCRPEHAAAVGSALARLGVEEQDVGWFLATHRHVDHTGYAARATGARRLMHASDLAEAPEELAALFAPYGAAAADAPDRIALEDLSMTIIHLGHHTPGSVALYHPATRALFVGDHVCFPRHRLPDDGGMTVPAESMRRYLRGFVARWAKAPRGTTARWGSLETFFAGLRQLSQCDAELLCTGHGPVVRGDIGGLLAELALDGSGCGRGARLG